MLPCAAYSTIDESYPSTILPTAIIKVEYDYQKKVILMINTYCKRCRTSFPIPDLSAEVLKPILIAIREDNTVLKAIPLIQKAGDLEIRKAKAVAMHITQAKGYCHKCKSKLSGSGQTECPKCQSINLDW
jgi:hypothetical protein